MVNKENLIPLDRRTKEEQRIITSKGGKASVEARRNKKMLREWIDMLLEKEMETENGESITGAGVLAVKLFEEAKNGNIKAFEVLRDTAGQKPAEKVVVSNIDPDVISEVERMVNSETD